MFFPPKKCGLATNPNLQVHISLQPRGVNLWCFTTWIIWLSKIESWKYSNIYLRHMGCKNIGIRKSGFVAKTQFLKSAWEIFLFDDWNIPWVGRPLPRGKLYSCKILLFKKPLSFCLYVRSWLMNPKCWCMGTC